MTLITRKTTPATASGTLARQPILQAPRQHTKTARQRSRQAGQDFRWLEHTANNRPWPLTTVALPLASRCHHNQYRRTGEPYLAHPLRIARTLYTLGARDDTLLAAALLHDTIEDTSMTEQHLRDVLPRAPEVVGLVCALTKRAGQSLDDYFETIRQQGGMAILIKVADRHDNLATMNGAFTPERMKNYLTETGQYIQPLCAYGLRHFSCVAPLLIPLSRQVDAMIAASWQHLTSLYEERAAARHAPRPGPRPGSSPPQRGEESRRTKNHDTNRHRTPNRNRHRMPARTRGRRRL